MIEINIDGKTFSMSEQAAYSLCQKIQQELTQPLKDGRIHTFDNHNIKIHNKSGSSDAVLTDC